MRRASASPDSLEARRWCEQCSRTIHAIEPRLAVIDCEDLASSLWQLDLYQALPPRDAAEKFMAEHLDMLVSVLMA